jgi:RimJ/RimL family protein N-acetyltransferase
LEKSAQFFVIVLNRDLVLGSISLSHIDRESRTARTGYFLASCHQGKGYGTLALAHLLTRARLKGLKAVSARLTTSLPASRRIWEKSGFPLRYAEDEVTAILDLRDRSPLL